MHGMQSSDCRRLTIDFTVFDAVGSHQVLFGCHS